MPRRRPAARSGRCRGRRARPGPGGRGRAGGRAVRCAGRGAGRRPAPRAGGGAPGAGVEIAAGAPAEHRLRQQGPQSAAEVAELLGRVAAVPALGQMVLDVRQQPAAPADGNVEEPVVEAAVLRRRELLMGMYTTIAEFLAGLSESGRRRVDVHAEQGGRHGYRFGLHLGVPQQTAGRCRKGGECPRGQRPVFGDEGLRGPHAPAAGGFEEFGQCGGHPLVGGPLADRVPHGHQQPGAQGGGRLALGELVEDTVQGGGRDHGGDVRRGGEADGRVVVRGLPVPGGQQRDGLGGRAPGAVPQPGGEGLVGLPGITAGRGWSGRGGWGVGTETVPSHARVAHMFSVRKGARSGACLSGRCTGSGNSPSVIRPRFSKAPAPPGHYPPRGCLTLAQTLMVNKALGQVPPKDRTFERTSASAIPRPV